MAKQHKGTHNPTAGINDPGENAGDRAGHLGEPSGQRPEVTSQRGDPTQQHPADRERARQEAGIPHARQHHPSATERSTGEQGEDTRNRGSGLGRSDEELQRNSESGTSSVARDRR